MPLVVIALLVVSLIVSPDLFKVLIFFHVVSMLFAALVLFMLVMFNDAFSSGVNAGMYEKESIYLLGYALASVGTMLLGIIAAIITKIFFDK